MLFEIEVGGGELLAAARAVEQFGERTITVGADDDRDMLRLLEHTGAEALRHAPGDAHDTPGAHELLEFAESADHPRLGVLANRTGVHEDHVGTVWHVHRVVAAGHELAVHEL